MRTRDSSIFAILLPLLLAGGIAGSASAQEAPGSAGAEAAGAAAIVAPEGQEAVITPPSPPVPPTPPVAVTGSAAGQRQVFTGNRTIEAGEVVEDIVVVGGELRVRGEVRGNVVVVGGDLVLEPSGSIAGNATVTGGRVVNEGGRVGGDIRAINGEAVGLTEEIQRAVAGTATATAGRERSTPAGGAQASRRGRLRSGFEPIRRGVAGVISTVALGLVLAGIGATLVFYGRPYLETVSDTARGATLRSGATGLAATFLIIPAFVVLVVALAVSIVGIPFLLVAVPLYPLAIFVALVFGLLAVSHAIGERTAEQGREVMDMRYRNSYAYLFTGLAMLLMPHLAAHLISMTGFLRFIGTVLHVITWMAIWAAATVGFGAVILSRAGTRRTFVAPTPDATLFDADDLLGDDPLGEPGNA
jgi:hypothetical protein